MSDPWKDILDADETILWQGAPNPALQLKYKSAMQPIFFAVWTAFAIFCCLMAAGAGPIWIFGLLFVGIGVKNLIGDHLWQAYVRRHTFYTLTDKRAFIATDVFGKRTLASYPIHPGQSIDLTEHSGLGTVAFAARNTRQQDNLPIAFERIPDARHVLGLMHNIQERQT